MSHFPRPTPNIAPSWNVAPTDRFRWSAMIPRSLDVTRRGLVQFWAKDIKVDFANISQGRGDRLVVMFNPPLLRSGPKQLINCGC